MFTLTCLSTSKMPSCLEAFFLPLSAWGNWGGGGGGGGVGGGMLSFIESWLMTMCSDSSSSCSLVFPANLGLWPELHPFFLQARWESLVHALPMDWAVSRRGTSLSPVPEADCSGY